MSTPAESVFDPLAYSAQQGSQQAAPFDPLNYSQSVAKDDPKKAAKVPEAPPEPLMDISKEPNLAKILYYGGKQAAGMAAHGIGTLVDVATGTSPGEGSHAESFAAPFSVPRTVQDVNDEANRPDIGKAYDRAFGTGPLATTLKERIPQAAEAIGTVEGIGGAAKGVLTSKPVAPVIEQGHPLTAVAESEANRISSALEKGRAAGMELPERTVSPTQAAANQIVRQEFNMPGGAPVTPKVLDAVRKENYAPAYQKVEQQPGKVQLGSAYEDDIENVDLSKINEKYRPPVGGSLTWPRSVELSKYLREKAADYFKEGTVESTEKGQAHWDAAQAVEDAVERRLKATGQPQTAADWDNGRVGYAKTYSVQSALDGAGNVVVPKLKSQLIRGKPLSGGLEDLATMGAVNPEAFRATPQAPRPSLLRRAAAASAPAIGGAIGGALGGGLGAGAGTAAGQHLGERIINP